ncbi:hypothetical protein ABIB25_000560 [Nakamurella sp. UYEF19]|uniref:hypothetical protein n=1 Tax=Nakamurella sp. UYEF19 TaxID=1756392 RepID=UPI003399B5F4
MWLGRWLVGTCLTYDGLEKFYRSIEWLEYLIEHFLRPGAQASATGLPYFEMFTFDHVLDGVVAANRRDSRELYVVDVEDNKVSKVLLRQGDPMDWEWETLPYEDRLDRQRDENKRRRRPRPPRRVVGPATHPLA